MSKKSCCYGCSKRTSDCHSTCKDYLDERAMKIERSKRNWLAESCVLSYRNHTYWRVRNNLAKTKGAVKLH